MQNSWLMLFINKNKDKVKDRKKWYGLNIKESLTEEKKEYYQQNKEKIKNI